MTALLSTLRDARFLTRERLTVYPLLILAAFAFGLVALIATAHGLKDYDGRPLGTDFSSFYVAGKLILLERNPFDPQILYHAEQAVFGTTSPFYSFSYPPIFLLLMAPLAFLPYPAALTLWLGLTLALYLTAMTMLERGANARQDRLIFLLLAATFPAVFITLLHGQNGFLSAALLTLGVACLDRRPVLAGFYFGCLAFKPQLGLLLPFLLAIDGRWKTILAATTTVALLALLSGLLFGWDSWRAFFAALHFSRTAILEGGAVGYEKMISIFAALRLWQAPLPVAYGAQGITALAAGGLACLCWRSQADIRLKGAVLCLASLLVTPFALDYDLMLLAPAFVLLVAEGKSRGFQPFELSLLTLLWALPLAARGLAMATHILLAPFAILALLVMVGRTARV